VGGREHGTEPRPSSRPPSPLSRAHPHSKKRVHPVGTGGDRAVRPLARGPCRRAVASSFEFGDDTTFESKYIISDGLRTLQLRVEIKV